MRPLDVARPRSGRRYGRPRRHAGSGRKTETFHVIS
jgi:hypothetical protein